MFSEKTNQPGTYRFGSSLRRWPKDIIGEVAEQLHIDREELFRRACLEDGNLAFGMRDTLEMIEYKKTHAIPGFVQSFCESMKTRACMSTACTSGKPVRHSKLVKLDKAARETAYYFCSITCMQGDSFVLVIPHVANPLPKREPVTHDEVEGNEIPVTPPQAVAPTVEEIFVQPLVEEEAPAHQPDTSNEKEEVVMEDLDVEVILATAHQAIAARLIEAREARGITVEQLTDDIRMTEDRYMLIEAGQAPDAKGLSAAKLAAVAAIFQVPITYFYQDIPGLLVASGTIDSLKRDEALSSLDRLRELLASL